MYIIGLLKKKSVQYRRQDLPLGPSDMFFRGLILLDTVILWAGHVPQERLMARRVRPDQRWDAGVRAGGGKPDSSAMKGRSMAVDQPCVSRTFPGVRQDMA
jgi:hypothetical protein